MNRHIQIRKLDLKFEARDPVHWPEWVCVWKGKILSPEDERVAKETYASEKKRMRKHEVLELVETRTLCRDSTVELA